VLYFLQLRFYDVVGVKAMHPNAFLQTYWRLDLQPKIFVAMSFAPAYEQRFQKIFKPAIESITISGTKLSAYRVDNSKTGDSILTDILNGIAHSQMVLADVSAVGRDSVSGEAYRNGNVMYEIGLALACRQTQEVILIRDDKEKFLFDVSTIPHMHLDFGNPENAKQQLHEELKARLRDRNFFLDARVEIAISQLSAEEVKLLKTTFGYTRDTAWGHQLIGLSNWNSIATSRLLDKQIIHIAGEFSNENTAFMFTDLGWIIQQRLKNGLRQFSIESDEKTVPRENIDE
jgi:hypothetical protein